MDRPSKKFSRTEPEVLTENLPVQAVRRVLGEKEAELPKRVEFVADGVNWFFCFTGLERFSAMKISGEPCAVAVIIYRSGRYLITAMERDIKRLLDELEGVKIRPPDENDKRARVTWHSF